MSRLLFVLIPLLLVLIGGSVFYTIYKASQPTAEIKGQKFQLEIAKKDKDKQIGLSKHKSLASDHAMLFIFDKPGYYSFWMRDMKFPIDIIFVKDDKIVDLYQNLPTNSLTIYSPTQPSDRVIEVNADLSKKYGFNVGDSVIFKNVK